MENENDHNSLTSKEKQDELQQKLDKNRQKLASLNTGIEHKTELLAKLNAEIDELNQLYPGSKRRDG